MQDVNPSLRAEAIRLITTAEARLPINLSRYSNEVLGYKTSKGVPIITLAQTGYLKDLPVERLTAELLLLGKQNRAIAQTALSIALKNGLFDSPEKTHAVAKLLAPHYAKVKMTVSHAIAAIQTKQKWNQMAYSVAKQRQEQIEHFAQECAQAHLRWASEQGHLRKESKVPSPTYTN